MINITKGQEKYEGWTNYETWCVNLWLKNDPITDDYLRSIALDPTKSLTDKVEELIDYVESLVEVTLLQPTFVSDLLQLSLERVNYTEIIKNVEL